MVKELMYVIATRGQHNKEIYLAYDEERTAKCKDPFKCILKWTDNIEEAIATFTITDAEEQAQRYFKNFKKWYVRPYYAIFEA